jgi:hypothetical protein
MPRGGTRILCVRRLQSGANDQRPLVASLNHEIQSPHRCARPSRPRLLRLRPERVFALVPTADDEGRRRGVHGWARASGYFLPLLFGTNTITGAALLIGRFVPLALTVLAPVIVNIVAVHLFLDPSGFPLTILVVALELFLAWSYRAAFRSLLRAGNDAAPAR